MHNKKLLQSASTQEVKEHINDACSAEITLKWIKCLKKSFPCFDLFSNQLQLI